MFEEKVSESSRMAKAAEIGGSGMSGEDRHRSHEEGISERAPSRGKRVLGSSSSGGRDPCLH